MSQITESCGRLAALFSILAMACLLALAASPRTAKAEYVFDSELSLTGGCAVRATDPVPDPPLGDCESGDHPAGPFKRPRGFATDPYGNMYVSGEGIPGRIDVFDSEGLFITELAVPNASVWNIAVDSGGNLYARVLHENSPQLWRFAPTTYNPAAGEIEYGNPPVLVLDYSIEVEEETVFLGGPTSGIAINPLNDHLLVHYGDRVLEFSSAKEGNEFLATIGLGMLSLGKWLAVDAARNRLYSSDFEPETNDVRLLVFELEAPHELVETVTGSDLPGKKFVFGDLVLAAAEGSGHFFAYDGLLNKVFQFNEDYEYEATIEHSFTFSEPSAIAFDNGPLSPNQGYLFVTSGTNESNSHSYAFGPPDPEPPVFESIGFGEVSETEAILSARINPEGAATHYAIEYTSNEDFESGATVAGEGDLPAGKDGVDVSAAASGLAPGTTYLFRVVATNEKGSDKEEASFNTYPALPPFGPCSNDPLRTGASALLPDCRAYELVTPADTNGRSPQAAGGSGAFFPMLQASPAGNKASFSISQGTLPGHEGTGAFNGQNYVASRGEEGWSTEIIGPNGTESVAPRPGGISPDQQFAFWATSGVEKEEGTAVIDDEPTTYIRYPDGHSELIGRGSLGTDSRVEGKLISENGTHVIFLTRSSFGFHEAVQLEEDAPGGGTTVIYDRTRDPITGKEETHVVSLLPGEVTPAAGENAIYRGASYDGEAVAFSIASKLYLRVHNEATYEIGEGATFAGVAAGGTRVFYLKGGNLYAYDVIEEAEIPFTNSGNITVVNVAEGGTRAYFVSNSVLVGEPNPEGDLPQGGQPNLYLSEEGLLSFVGTVTKRDVEGEVVGSGGANGGLGLWIPGLEADTPGRDPSRTTPDGDTLLFESRADLTDFESEEFAQVYRYDVSEASLECLSCNPTGTKPTSDATLQSLGSLDPDSPVGGTTRMLNIRPAGDRAFFQSSEPLVVSDTDGLQDVYEWEKQGVGSCDTPGGCTYLISSGQSASDNDYLFAVSADGDNAFFVSADRLLGRDTETTRSIYDARVGGGFSEPAEEICVGEGCRPPLAGVPALTVPARPALQADDNVSSPRKRCPKTKRRVKRAGKVRCVRKHRKRQARRRQGAHRRGARR